MLKDKVFWWIWQCWVGLDDLEVLFQQFTIWSHISNLIWPVELHKKPPGLLHEAVGHCSLLFWWLSMNGLEFVNYFISFDASETAGNLISTWQAWQLAAGKALDPGILLTCHWSMHIWPCLMCLLDACSTCRYQGWYWDFYRALWNPPVKVKVMREKTGQYCKLGTVLLVDAHL